jgi:DeoR family fructose operon transcriptional repressor
VDLDRLTLQCWCDVGEGGHRCSDVLEDDNYHMNAHSRSSEAAMAPMQAQRTATVQGTLAAEARHRWLSDRLATQGAVTIADAAAALEVSEMTIRRDLAELEHRGTARRVRGGAQAAGPQTFAARRQTAGRAKAHIAAKLAELVPASGVIAFDASSTVMRLTAGLGAARDLTILTNGPDTFSALQGVPGVTALLTGGQLDVRTGSLVGPLAGHSAAQFALHTFFASAAATDPTVGSLEETLDDADVKRNIAATADRVILAVDASKLASRAVAVGLDWERIDMLVTDLDPTDEHLEPYRAVVQLL